ncbi:hypothetical protein ACFL3S_08245 [Gemmatimonadota bacterium]
MSHTRQWFHRLFPRTGAGTKGKPGWGGPTACLTLVVSLVLVGPMVPEKAASQGVGVSPTALFLHRGERSSRLILFNQGDRPVEVEISFAFGYATSDSAGRVTVPLSDTAPPGEPSLTPYLRAFPQRLRLQPGQRGAVRVLVQAPPDLPSGEYWARVLVSSTGAQIPVEQRVGQSTITLNMKSVIAVAANYRHGPVGTSLEVESAEATAEKEEVRLLLDLARGGNAAWLGRVEARIVDGRGLEMGRTVQDVAVYRPLRWGVTIPLERPLDGDGYIVQYVLSTVRPDEDREDILSAPAVRGSVPVG